MILHLLKFPVPTRAFGHKGRAQCPMFYMTVTQTGVDFDLKFVKNICIGDIVTYIFMVGQVRDLTTGCVCPDKKAYQKLSMDNHGHIFWPNVAKNFEKEPKIRRRGEVLM